MGTSTCILIYIFNQKIPVIHVGGLVSNYLALGNISLLNCAHDGRHAACTGGGNSHIQALCFSVLGLQNNGKILFLVKIARWVESLNRMSNVILDLRVI